MIYDLRTHPLLVGAGATFRTKVRSVTPARERGGMKMSSEHWFKRVVFVLQGGQAALAITYYVVQLIHIFSA